MWILTQLHYLSPHLLTSDVTWRVAPGQKDLTYQVSMTEINEQEMRRNKVRHGLKTRPELPVASALSWPTSAQTQIRWGFIDPWRGVQDRDTTIHFWELRDWETGSSLGLDVYWQHFTLLSVQQNDDNNK